VQSLLAAEAFYRRNFLSNGSLRRRYAGADRRPVEVHRAGSALCDPATKLRSGQADMVAYDPEQWRCRIDINSVFRTVYFQGNHRNLTVLQGGRPGKPPNT